MSFAHLYIGLARESGLRVYYLRVADLQNFEKDGDLIVASVRGRDVLGQPTERRILEFSDQPVKKYHDTERISDLTAIALYYSNLGAQPPRISVKGVAIPSGQLAGLTRKWRCNW